MLNTNYTSKFNEVYQSLNTAQQQAVDTIEGPVMVIAGPGTGKTQILAARIAKILQKTDVLPENILCLTYTDAGTIAMRKRLNSFIGPDSYRVGIYTFHAFCNIVIQENLDVFGFKNLDPVSQLEQIQFVREIIDNLSQDNPLKRYTGDAYFEVSRLLNLFEIIKKEDLTPEYIHVKITEYVTDLENREEYIYKRGGKRKNGSIYTKGDLNTDKINAEIDRMNLLAAAANTFKIYQDTLVKNNRYDFADMLLWVINAFKNNETLLANYQERYQYILVDEFQDTNGAQNDVLSLLVNYWDEPNLFVVGDEDQSIYRFQGASVENIKAFGEKYEKSLNRVLLTNNYRSSQLILNSASAIISKSNPLNRLQIDKSLVALNADSEKNAVKPAITQFTNTAHEIVFITNQIVQHINNGISPKEIAVIYRNHKQADEIITYLQSKKIGVNVRRKENILEQTVIKKLLCILRFVKAELKISHSGEPYLFELLHYPEFGLPAIEIAKMATAISSKNFSERKTSWREELKLFNAKSKPTLFDDKKFASKFADVSKILEDLIKQATQVTLQELVFLVINKCGLLVHALNQIQSQWNLELINTFFNYLKTETLKKPSYNLTNLIDDIELIIDNNLRIEAEKIFAHSNGVNFITAHSSKGLEFEVVFVLGCTTQFWDKAKPNRGYKLPDNLLANSIVEDEESRRLFYVALTRAKKHLFISYSLKDLNDKELEPSVFVAELNESKTIDNTQPEVNEADVEAFYATIFTMVEPILPKGILQSGYVDELLEKYSLSVTHLNNYLKCPLSFYFNNFIRVPAPKSSAMTFGSAVHHAIEYLFDKMLKSDDKEFPELKTFINDFKWYMFRHRDSFTDIEFERKLEYAEKILPKYYDSYITKWNKVVVVERSYKNINMEGAIISGKLDKLEFDGNYVNVVDYKTGKYKNAKTKFGRPDNDKVNAAKAAEKDPKFEDEFGGDYWRQAVFYKLLLDYDKTRDWVMRTTEFDFVEPDKDTGEYYKEKVAITPQDIDVVKAQIKEVFAKIKNKEFEKGCGKPDCEWCNFTSEFYNGANVDLPQLDEESLHLPLS